MTKRTTKPVQMTPEDGLRRAQLLDDLLRLDGREAADHAFVGSYTGLARPFSRLMDAEEKIQNLSARVFELEELLSLVVVAAQECAANLAATAGPSHGKQEQDER